jgi:hypothetical protein
MPGLTAPPGPPCSTTTGQALRIAAFLVIDLVDAAGRSYSRRRKPRSRGTGHDGAFGHGEGHTVIGLSFRAVQAVTVCDRNAVTASKSQAEIIRTPPIGATAPMTGRLRRAMGQGEAEHQSARRRQPSGHRDETRTRRPDGADQSQHRMDHLIMAAGGQQALDLRTRAMGGERANGHGEGAVQGGDRPPDYASHSWAER